MNTPQPSDAAAAFLAAIVASTDDAIVGKSLDGTVLSWNGGAERIFGWSAAEMIGRSVRVLIPEDRQEEEDRILASVSTGERVPTFETERRRKDGSLVTVTVTVSPVHDAEGRIIAASKIARDISEAKRVLARLEDSEQRFRMLADNMPQLAWIADHSGRIFWFNPQWFAFTGTTLEEMEGWGWKRVLHPDHSERVMALWERHLASGEEWEDTFPLRSADGSDRWFLSRAQPIRDSQGRIAYWFGTNTDVTAMRDAEQRIELLMMEVNHRSKNLLAVVQAVARRTAVQGGDFVARLEQRIQAIAANQDLLVNRAWSSIPMREMLKVQLEVLGDAARQIECVGPEMMLSPGAAETIAMAVHEMATNAVKYGALGYPAGRVRIGWSLTGASEAGREEFAIEWAESGGPPIAAPETHGFGSRIIADVPRNKLDAEVSVEFAPTGFRWSLRCPAANVTERSGRPLLPAPPPPGAGTIQ